MCPGICWDMLLVPVSSQLTQLMASSPLLFIEVLRAICWQDGVRSGNRVKYGCCWLSSRPLQQWASQRFTADMVAQWECSFTFCFEQGVSQTTALSAVAVLVCKHCTQRLRYAPAGFNLCHLASR
jgi:hypothetical protein